MTQAIEITHVENSGLMRYTFSATTKSEGCVLDTLDVLQQILNNICTRTVTVGRDHETRGLITIPFGGKEVRGQVTLPNRPDSCWHGQVQYTIDTAAGVANVYLE